MTEEPRLVDSHDLDEWDELVEERDALRATVEEMRPTMAAIQAVDPIRRAIADPGHFTERVRNPHCDTRTCTCEPVAEWCARAVVIALAGSRPTELAAIALWIEEDAASEDQEIADYARGIAARIRDRAAAQPGENGDTWCCAKCKKLAEEGM